MTDAECTCGWDKAYLPVCPDCGGQTEPRKRGSLVRDRDGDLWRRGNTRWNCQAQVDGERVTRVGRLPWYALLSQYGPLTYVTPPGSSEEGSP